MDKLMSILKKHDADTLVNGCLETLPQELRRAAFANACNIVLADGVLEDDEREFITNLSSKLGLDQQVAQDIGTVMVIKNKG